MGEMTTVAQKQDLEPGTSLCVEVGEHKIALFNVEGTYYAIWKHVHSQRGTSLGGQREFNHGDLSLARCSVRSRDGECVKTTSFTRCHPL